MQQWHGLSDEGLEAAVDDRLSFRRFAGIPLAESVPDHSSVWRFREQLARRGLAERVLAEVNRQLDAKGLILRKGTLIDASIIEAAVKAPKGNVGEVSPRDPDAGWTKKNGKSLPCSRCTRSRCGARRWRSSDTKDARRWLRGAASAMTEPPP